MEKLNPLEPVQALTLGTQNWVGTLAKHLPKGLACLDKARDTRTVTYLSAKREFGRAWSVSSDLSGAVSSLDRYRVVP